MEEINKEIKKQKKKLLIETLQQAKGEFRNGISPKDLSDYLHSALPEYKQFFDSKELNELIRASKITLLKTAEKIEYEEEHKKDDLVSIKRKDGITYNRKKKKNGRIGSGNHLDIAFRRQIMTSIFQKNNGRLTPSELIQYTISDLKTQKPDYIIPTKSAFERDIRELNLKFNPSAPVYDKEKSSLRLLSMDFAPKIRFINFLIGASQYTLYDSRYDYSNYSYSDFLEQTGKYNPVNSTAQVKEDRICSIIITFWDRGYENIFAEAFDGYFKNHRTLLYISLHMYCIELNFYYKDRKDILDSIFELFDELIFIDF